MIKKFKIFEAYRFEENLEDDLVDYLSQDDIETYYNEHSGGFDEDVEEIIAQSPDIIWRHIDDEAYVKDTIQDEINSRDLRDFDDEDEYRDFITDHWTNDKEKKVLELYKEKQYEDEYEDVISKIDGKVSIILSKKENYKITITSIDNVKKYTIPDTHDMLVNDGDTIQKGEVLATLRYDDYMYDDMDIDELRDIIRDEGQEYDFIDDIITKRYEDETAQGIIESIYGRHLDAKELYKIVYDYVDDKEIKDEWEETCKENEDFDVKRDFVKTNIYNNTDFQRTILKAKDSNVLKLAELFELQGSNDNIADEYDFQKLYIEEYFKEHKDDEDEDEDNLKATALRYVYDNYDLDPDIADEYNDYMWMVNAKKYNVG